MEDIAGASALGRRAGQGRLLRSIVPGTSAGRQGGAVVCRSSGGRCRRSPATRQPERAADQQGAARLLVVCRLPAGRPVDTLPGASAVRLKFYDRGLPNITNIIGRCCTSEKQPFYSCALYTFAALCCPFSASLLYAFAPYPFGPLAGKERPLSGT